MTARSVQLVLHYHGAMFAGWQRQPEQRTVQGVVEETLARLCGTGVKAIGAGRTDAGVHARGQAVGVKLPERWRASSIRRALNALLPHDIWVEAAHEMREDFHPRYSATSRRYTYYVGTDEGARSPFRRDTEWAFTRPLDRQRLDDSAELLRGDHCFVGFAVRGTAPEHDDHRCIVTEACWSERPDGTGLAFRIEANRFLHHMVRFLVGTMVEEASGAREAGALARLLTATDNLEVSPPAPAHALFLDRVVYPPELYVNDA
jgi:tRNA pseudouridine38-40 synthase